MTTEQALKKFYAALHLCALLVPVLSPVSGHTQVFQESYDWKEGEVPPPPAYDTGKLLTFKLGAASMLVYGVDPASISISKADSVVRYVMVATSESGARNVMYEGLRCATGEFKTYARQTGGTWQAVSNPEWRSVFDRMPSPHALVFARMAACDARAPAGNVAEIVSKMKNPNQYLDQ